MDQGIRIAEQGIVGRIPLRKNGFVLNWSVGQRIAPYRRRPGLKDTA